MEIGANMQSDRAKGVNPYVGPELSSGTGSPPLHSRQQRIHAVVPSSKYKFWNGDRVHYQISTAADKPVKNLEGRSWFGVTEVVGGDAEIKELGTPLFTVLRKSEPPTTILLLEAYRRALEDSILAWKRGRMTDAQAQYLGTFVRYNFAPNRIDSLPETLAPMFAEYRSLENDHPPSRPGLPSTSRG